MKKMFLVLATMLFATGLSVIISNANHFYAQQRGCCVQRDPRTGQWYRNGLNFRQCQDLNLRLDGRQDNLFNPTGSVWWNVNC